MKMLAQFRLTEMQSELRGCEKQYAEAKIFASGSFIWEQDHDVWALKNGTPPDGSLTGYFGFVNDEHAERTVYIGPLNEEHDCFEFTISLPMSQASWISSMIGDCERTGKVLSLYAAPEYSSFTDDSQIVSETKDARRILIRPFRRVIDFPEAGAAA